MPHRVIKRVFPPIVCGITISEWPQRQIYTALLSVALISLFHNSFW